MLQLRNVSKSFSSKQVLRSVSLDVCPGEIYGYVGGNGAGKTTSMRIMLGISRADSGTVTLNGEPINNSVRATIGYMPEERGLYPKMTPMDQLTFFGVIHGLTIDSARDSADYWLFRMGLSDLAHNPLETLSLGNQQRVQLAAALVHAPAALILDEPFSGLDPGAVKTISSIIREETDKGIPVIFSSHQLDLVEKLCDRIGILRNGRLIAEGTFEELGRADGRQYLVDASVNPNIWVPLVAQHTEAESQSLSIQSQEGNRTRIKVPDNFNEQAIIDVIRANGALTAFYQWHPPLTEIYDWAMSSTEKSPVRE